MKNMSEIRNEDAIEFLADIVDPVATIATDKKFMDDIRKNFKKPEERTRLISYGLKNHKAEIISILAAYEGMSVEEYRKSGKCNPWALPKMLIKIINDKEFVEFFLSSAETEETPSGSATESTEESAQ